MNYSGFEISNSHTALLWCKTVIPVAVHDFMPPFSTAI